MKSIPLELKLLVVLRVLAGGLSYADAFEPILTKQLADVSVVSISSV
jgi:hypothetical protein